MNSFCFVASIAFLLSVSSVVLPTGASSPVCQQALDNCSNEYTKGHMNCANAHMFQECVEKAFSSCSADQFDQSLYYGTLSASQSNVQYSCVNPNQMAQTYSTANSEVRASVLTCISVSLASVVLFFTRN